MLGTQPVNNPLSTAVPAPVFAKAPSASVMGTLNVAV